jgi:hypothetical protein
MVDFTLSAEQIKLQQKARKFAVDEILPVVNFFDEMDVSPKFLWLKLTLQV